MGLHYGSLERTLEQVEKEISNYQAQLERLQHQRSFPYIYIVLALPSGVVAVLLSLTLPGAPGVVTSIIGGLFFALLLTCAYVVVFQTSSQEATAEASRRLRQLHKSRLKILAGLRAEREVSYTLSWLPSGYLVLNDLLLVGTRHGEQQFDHLVVGPNGVFHLETKSVNGTVLIGPNGDWSVVRTSGGRLYKEGMESPRYQMERHEAVMREVLEERFPGLNIPIQGLVVMAHPKTVIEGREDRFMVVKNDGLLETITRHGSAGLLSPRQVRRIALALTAASPAPLEGGGEDEG